MTSPSPADTWPASDLDACLASGEHQRTQRHPRAECPNRDWPETRTRCARCGMEDHSIEDCHAWCGHGPDAPCEPTVPDRAPAGTPNLHTCPECGQTPDTARPTCLTCITARARTTS